MFLSKFGDEAIFIGRRFLGFKKSDTAFFVVFTVNGGYKSGY